MVRDTRESNDHHRFEFILGCRQIGLLLGPCFTILLKQMNFNLLGIPVTMHNSPGLLMAILWIVLAILTIFFFFDLPQTMVKKRLSDEND